MVAKKKAAQDRTRTTKKASSRTTKGAPKKKSAPKPATKKSAAKKVKAVKKSPATKKRASGPAKKAPVKKAVKKKTPKKSALNKPAPKKTTRSASKTKPTTKRSLTPPPDAPAQEEPAGPLSISQLRKIKSGLSRKELDGYRQLLLQKRAEIIGDVTAMQNDACNKNADGNLSHMPVHMADIGSDNYEQEFTLGLVESERRLLGEIEMALERISNRVYGVCEISGVPIGKPRLDAKPWARYCIDVARDLERQHHRM